MMRSATCLPTPTCTATSRPINYDGLYRVVGVHQPIDAGKDLTYTYDLLGHHDRED